MTRQLIMTPYGADALARLREVVAQAKRRDPMTMVTILVPHHLAGIVARRDLAKGFGGGPGIAGVKISTIARLSEELAAVALHPRRPQTRLVTAAAWRAALDTDPGVFREVAGHSATIEALVRAHSELRDLDPAALDAVAAGGVVAADLVRLHRRVTRTLERDWYDETDLLRTATTRADDALGAVVLYLPQVLTRAEGAFVGALEEVGDLTVLLGLTGNRRADHDLLLRFEKTDEWSDSVAEPIADLLMSSSDSDDEVRCVGRAVLTDLADGVRADRIAVLYAAPDPYGRLLHERFVAMGITTNGPGVRAVADRAAARLLLELLELIDLPRTELFRALSAAAVVDFSGERIPLSRWERASREAGVVRGDDWELRLARVVEDGASEIRELHNADDSQAARRAAVERRVQDASALCAFAAELRRRLAEGTSLTTWRELADWALELLCDLLPESTTATMPAEEQAAAAAVVNALQRLGTLDELDHQASLRGLRDVLRIELDTAQPRVGTFGHGVFVGPISASVGLELDRAYLVGLAEDLYPGRVAEDALLPNAVRARSFAQLPQLGRWLDDQHRALLAAMQSAARVTVSVPRGDLRRSTHRLPSRWLLRTLRTLAGVEDLAMTEWDRNPQRYGGAVQVSGSFAGELLTTSQLADEQEWRTRAIAAGDPTDDGAVRAAKTLSQARAGGTFTRYDGNLAGVRGLPDLLTSEMTVSPTALEAYATCPHAWFVQRLLGIEPLQQPEDIITIRAFDIGSFLHETLDELAKEAPLELPQQGRPWTAAQRERLQQLAQRKAEEFEQRGLTGHPRLWAVEREQLLHDLVRILDDDDAERSSRGASVIASELEFGMHGFPPVEISVPWGPCAHARQC